MGIFLRRIWARISVIQRRSSLGPSSSRLLSLTLSSRIASSMEEASFDLFGCLSARWMCAGLRGFLVQRDRWDVSFDRSWYYPLEWDFPSFLKVKDQVTNLNSVGNLAITRTHDSRVLNHPVIFVTNWTNRAQLFAQSVQACTSLSALPICTHMRKCLCLRSRASMVYGLCAWKPVDFQLNLALRCVSTTVCKLLA